MTAIAEGALLWEPFEGRARGSAMAAYIRWLAERKGLDFDSYPALWEWSVADVVDAVARAGLRIETVREWPYSNGCRFFPNMVALDGKRWALAPGSPKVSLMYGLAATA